MECLIFKTERTIVRQFQATDFEEYFKLESNPEVMKYITVKPRTRQEAEERFNQKRDEYRKDPGFGLWAVCFHDQNKLIGTANLNFIPGTSIRQIGYIITPEQQGKGLATELSSGLLTYGRNSCGLTEVSAVCSTGNEASEKVIQKVGMKYKGKFFYEGIECLHYQTELVK